MKNTRKLTPTKQVGNLFHFLLLCGMTLSLSAQQAEPKADDDAARRRVILPSRPALPSLDLFRDPEIVKTFAAIPVQESGRIKPLENLASYRLLRFRARRSLWLTDSGEMEGKPLIDPATKQPIAKADGKPLKLSAMEWLLMSWFRPDIGKTVPLFKVDNSSAITELGLTAKAKRDQYSYEEIEPARQLLAEKMQQYSQIPSKKQSAEQRMIVQLAANFLDYEFILTHFDFIRAPAGKNEDSLPAGVEKPLRLSKSLNALAADIRKGDVPPMQKPWFSDFGKAAIGAMMAGNPEMQLRIFPPAPKAQEIWHGPGETLLAAIKSDQDADAAQLAWLTAYEEVYLALPDAEKFKTASKAFLAKVQDAAALRGEGSRVGLELHYLRADYFHYAQWLFLGGLVFALLSIVPDARQMTRIAYGFICAGLFLSLVGTVLGGIWANYSWGRFWGWDPKENGALMIVLMCLVILHARLGGYIKETGLHVCNLILGSIVIFSWFGVNQLGVGLHAYGFTDGIWPRIYSYWLVQAGFMVLGLAVIALSRGSKLDLLEKLWALLAPWIKVVAKSLGWLLTGAATALAVTGVVIRCVIMQRPPITTLYETMLFIGASGAILGLMAELLTRKGLGLLVSALAGVSCMMLAIQFEASEAADTMQQLQAVLITNFWLTTHVPLINLGYAACMVAAIISQAYFCFKIISFVIEKTGIWKPAPTEQPEGEEKAPEICVDAA